MINIELLISQSIKNHDSVKTNVLRDIKNEILKFKTAKNAKEYKACSTVSYTLTMMALVAFGVCLKVEDYFKAKEEK